MAPHPKSLENDLFPNATVKIDYAKFWEASRMVKAHRTRTAYEILSARFSDTGDPIATYAQVGDKLGVSRERAMQLVGNALRLMRRSSLRHV